MNLLRMVVFLLLSILGGWIINANIYSAFSDAQLVIERDGIMNIFAGYGCFFIGLYVVIYVAKEQFRLNFNVGEFNKVVGGLVITSLILSVVNFAAINRQVEGYTECKNLREISSRYSSRTYAISPELCDSLKQ
ncbi:hypothetical protein V6560_000693 [Vibrio parahaemolyticus]